MASSSAWSSFCILGSLAIWKNMLVSVAAVVSLQGQRVSKHDSMRTQYVQSSPSSNNNEIGITIKVNMILLRLRAILKCVENP
jgi:hypothetical protein